MTFKIRLYTQDPELWAVVHDTTHGDRHFFHQGTSQGVQLGPY